MISTIRESVQAHSISIKANETNWSNIIGSSDLYPLKSDKLTAYDPVPEIKKLVKELAQLEGVKRVRAIATSFPDIHWVDFQVELEEGNTALLDATWDRIQDLVIDYEWKLIDISAEEWYFRPQMVDRFYPLKDQVIADSNEKQRTSVSGLKMWSINSSFNYL